MKKTLTSKQVNAYIKKNWNKKASRQIARDLGLADSSVRARADKIGLPKKSTQEKVFTIPEQIENDKTELQSKYEKASDTKKYKLLLAENEELQKIVSVKNELYDYRPVVIRAKKSGKNSEAVAFALASDWHVEQKVDQNKILYPNAYTLDIAKERATQFFQNTLRLLKKEQQDVTIKTLVLWLGGDFITGNIHTENLKVCQLGPAQAICFARDLLISGIQFLLDNSEVDILIPFNHGNHARITEKVWLSTEEDNSLEYILYDDIAFHFKENKRVKMVPPQGSLATVDVYGLKIGFTHGHHGFRYLDGVGGLYIPARKWIMRKFAKAKYYLICMGHWHQYLQDTMFLCNGSMIGYDQYADSRGLEYDIPKQTFFLIDSKRLCRTVTVPILFNV